jgi:hypothetical protein
MKITKIIEKIVNQLDIGKILVSIHEYNLSVNHENKSPTEDMGIKTVKTVINELIKIRRESIWEDYASVKMHHIADQHMYKWIQIILKSLQP